MDEKMKRLMAIIDEEEEIRKERYKSYLGDFEYEWGTTKGAMSFEEFCKECEKYGWEM